MSRSRVDERDRLPTLTARPRRAERGALAAVTLAFLAVCAFWAVLTPAFQAPDEHAHLSTAIRLTEELSWPAPGEACLSPKVLDARGEGELPAEQRSTFAELDDVPACPGVDQMTQHPPLYYGFAAAVLEGMDYEDDRADQVLIALRLAGLIFVLPLPLLVWDSIRRLTGRPRAGIVGACALLAVPQLAQIAGSVSNDGITMLWCSSVIWLCVRVMTGDDRRRILVALGVVLGLALFTKGTALPFVIFTGTVLVMWPRGTAWATRVLRSFFTLALAFVIGGWWWLRNLLIYQQLQPNGLDRIHDTKPWEPGTGPDIVHYIDLFWSRVSVRFWGEFGLLDYPLPELVTDTLSVVALVVIVGYAYGRHPLRREAIVLTLPPLVVVVTLVAHTWGFYVRTQLPGGLQGRYLYVAIVSLIALSAIAWMRFVRPTHHRRVGVVVIIGSAFLAVLGPFRQYIGAYEGSQYRVTSVGIRDWLTYSAVSTPALVVTSVVVATSGALALLIAIRYVMARDEGLATKHDLSPDAADQLP